MAKPVHATETPSFDQLQSSAIDSEVYLVPRPSNHPQDPLTWNLSHKLCLLLVICLAAFVGNVAALSGQEAYPVQAKVYRVTALESSYSISAAMSGLATGAFICVPLANIFGRWSITLWSLLGSLACAVWSAQMTHETDYIDFIVSRLFSGLFGAVPSAVGGSIIFDVFYLHQRGRAFACYESATLLGATIGPTISGFIAGTTSWSWCFWWTVPLLAVTAILVFWLADETSFDRVQERPRIEKPQSFIRNRITLFAPGTLAVDALPTAEVIKSAFLPLAIMLSPVTIICGLFTLIAFGWLLINDILSPMFLQYSVEKGGYAFTPTQNAAFSFAGWFAIAATQLIGIAMNDKLPLWICKEYYSGIWKPELRLYIMVITVVFCPVGLGICGVALQRHFHYMVFAFGYFVTAVSVLVSVPVATNYVAECFTHLTMECTLVMTFYRLSWGVVIPFFISRWAEKVGISWVYGTAALITVASWGLIYILIREGHNLRQKTFFKGLVSSEEGQTLFHVEGTEVLSVV